ncbi:MAG: AAA family ATPase, partial [Methylobacteriaceae bacterium]|nr:AAA family ATPase [Methylobacteriaceae bacterium]
MLVQLAIRDIVLIDRLELSFGPGLSVLTGETGAGKSILLDAFALALGARGDGALVRVGQMQGQVTAAFDLPADHPARRIAAGQAIEVEGDLILRRAQMADGRTRAFVNDTAVSVQALRAIAATLVEIHGQHDDRALVDAAAHRALLDAYGGLGAEAGAVAAAHRRRRELEEERAREAARVETARAEADFLRHAHAELDKLAPEAGEEERLAARRTAMMQAEKVAGELKEAHETLAGDSSIIAALASTLRRLERRHAQAPTLIEPPAKTLDLAIDALEHAREALERALEEAAFDPRELERIEERLFALRGASRKYATPVERLPDLALRYAADLAALDAGEARLAALAGEVAAAEAAYRAAAERLSAGRRKAAAQLDKAVMRELAPLKLERARFFTQIDSDPQTAAAEGWDRVEFWVETNPGARPG